jgi:hypothetical protein
MNNTISAFLRGKILYTIPVVLSVVGILYLVYDLYGEVKFLTYWYQNPGMFNGDFTWAAAFEKVGWDTFILPIVLAITFVVSYSFARGKTVPNTLSSVAIVGLDMALISAVVWPIVVSMKYMTDGGLGAFFAGSLIMAFGFLLIIPVFIISFVCLLAVYVGQIFSKRKVV